MQVLDPQTLVEGVCRVDIDVADRSALLAGLESLRRVRARADLAEIAIARRLESFTATTEKDVSAAANRAPQHGERVRGRSRAIEKVPALVKELANGALSGEHADSVAKALRAAPAGLRKALAESANTLVELAAVSGLTPQELSDRLSKETARLAGDGGASTLERQRRATRLRTWVDRGDGTFRLYGVFDPLTGVVLHGRLQAAMAAMFADGFPPMAPDDPNERQDFLRALALIALTAGQATTKSHRPCNDRPASHNRKRNRAHADGSGVNDPDHETGPGTDESSVSHTNNSHTNKNAAHANATAHTYRDPAHDHSALTVDDNSDTDSNDSDPNDTDPHDTDPNDTDPHDTDPHDTDPHDTDPHDTDPHDTDPHDTEVGDTVVTITVAEPDVGDGPGSDDSRSDDSRHGDICRKKPNGLGSFGSGDRGGGRDVEDIDVVDDEGDARWASFSSGGPPRFGRNEVVVVVDIGHLDRAGYPTVDWGLPINLPWSTVTDLCQTASISRIVVRDGNVIEAPGNLQLGRTTRLANRAQRRALRALYPTCPVPRCSTAYEHTKLHHVIWWRNGGTTDLANLLPLCWKHHDRVHEGGWQITLGPNRELTINLPDGQQMKTGPPSRNPAP